MAVIKQQNWKQTTLGKIALIKGGKRLPLGSSLQKTANNHPYIRVTNLNENKIINVNEYVPDAVFPTIARYTVNANDLIISIVGTIGAIALVPKSLEQASLTENCVKILVDEEKIDRKYLYYFLTSRQGQAEIKSNTVGAVQAKLPIYGVQNINLPLPPLLEQRAIAAVLSSFDDKIELLRSQNQTLEKIAQTLFKQWFTDFNFPNEQGKPYKKSDGKMVNSELGEIPEGWRVGRFTDIANVLSGGTPKTSDQNYWNGDIPFFTPKDAKDTFYTMKTEKNITQEGLEKCNSSLFPSNTVFITARGTVGKCTLASCNMAMNQSCYALNGKETSNLFIFLLTKQLIASFLKVAIYNTQTNRTPW